MTTFMEPTTTVVPILPILDAEIVAVEEHLPEPAQTTEVVPYVAPVPIPEPKRSLFWWITDDPYVLLMTLAGSLGLAIVGTVIYGIIQIVLAIMAFFAMWGSTIVGGILLLIVLALCGGGAACAGLHCGGCRG